MKLNIDLGYILKRLIVIGLGFILISQLKSCDVFAYSSTVSVTGGYLYYGTGNNNIACSSIPSINLGGNFNVFGCSYSGTYLTTVSRYNIRTPQLGISGYGTYSFYVSGQTQISSVTLTTSSSDYVCDLNTGIISLNNDLVLYSVTCSNVPVSDLRSIIVRIRYSTGNYTSLDTATISQMWNITLNDDVSQAVSDASNQAHQDSQNTQNAINGVNNSITDSDVSSASENGNSIFDVDENGQSTNSNVSNYGLESVITAPIQILERATDVCSPLSFTIFQKTITLPCGDSLFWNRDFSSQSSIFSKGVSGSGLNSTRNTFRAFWNLFFGGAIIFHLLTILYEVCQKAIDPFDDTLYTISDSIDARSKSSKVVRDSDGDSSRFTSDMNSIRVGGLAK